MAMMTMMVKQLTFIERSFFAKQVLYCINSPAR